MLIDGRHPSEIISYLATEFKVDSTSRFLNNLENSFRLLNLISQSLISKEKQNYRWISRDEFLLLFNHPKYPAAFQLYIGLLYQQSGEISFQFSDGNSQTLRELLRPTGDIPAVLNQLQPQIASVYNRANLVDQSMKTISDTPLQDVSYDHLYRFTQATLNFMKAGSGLKMEILKQDLDNTDEDEFFYVFGLSSDLSLDLRMKNYSSAVVNTATILDKVFQDDDRFKEFRTNLVKYGSFMATVAESENSDEVKKAIEGVALPPGSASLKKKTKFNIAVNSYFGLFGANEDLRLDNKNADVIGITAPVGISVNLPLNFSKVWLIKHLPFLNKDGSITVFGSIIDIGAVTAYRIHDDSTQSLPEIKLKNIVAPGAYLIYGFPGVPLSIGAGWQAGAELRNIVRATEGEELSVQLIPSAGYRFMVFAAVDMPLFNLYTKPR
jgi:hypothetical protein